MEVVWGQREIREKVLCQLLDSLLNNPPTIGLEVKVVVGCDRS
jgi:hypothetical protein